MQKFRTLGNVLLGESKHMEAGKRDYMPREFSYMPGDRGFMLGEFGYMPGSVVIGRGSTVICWGERSYMAAVFCNS